jgi:hypothetical protein
MPDARDKDERKALEEEVWVAISAFEQILEAMPNDRASLEALSHAYGQIGDHAREKEYLIRYGNVLLDAGDASAAQSLIDRIRLHAAEDARAKALVDRIERLLAAPSADAVPAPAAVAKALGGGLGGARGGFSMADELSFAWRLMEAGQLTEEEYASVVHDLTEMSSSETLMTTSVLHALEFRTSKNLEKIMAFVAKDCGTPIVTLSSFAVTVEAMIILPLDFMIRRGVLVFEFIGSEALVAIMNPYNKALRAELAATINRACHFFIALPTDFDQALVRMRTQLEEKSAAEKAQA